MICAVCRCTDQTPCVDTETGETCAWMPPSSVIAGEALCSFCAYFAALDRLERGIAPFPYDAELLGPEDPAVCALRAKHSAPLVELFSDYEADRFLRARRAGA